MQSKGILLIHCQDQPGIIAEITNFINDHKGNIIDLDEHVDTEEQMFFMRVEWSLKNFDISTDKIKEVFNEQVASKYKMSFELHFTFTKPRVAIFVSKYAHCLYDILGRYHSKEWDIEIPLIISNHDDMRSMAEAFKIPYYHIPLNKDNKEEQEPKQIQLLKDHHIDLVILARYMQILSSDFIAAFPNKIINIHHSFLPAFAGAKPYHSAYKRGVKIIGASSHYVNEDLDEGPLIEQDVVRVTHKDSVTDLMHKGRDLEKIVLSRAIWSHIKHKVLVYRNKTILFD